MFWRLICPSCDNQALYHLLYRFDCNQCDCPLVCIVRLQHNRFSIQEIPTAQTYNADLLKIPLLLTSMTLVATILLILFLFSRLSSVQYPAPPKNYTVMVSGLPKDQMPSKVDTILSQSFNRQPLVVRTVGDYDIGRITELMEAMKDIKRRAILTPNLWWAKELRDIDSKLSYEKSKGISKNVGIAFATFPHGVDLEKVSIL